MSDNHARSITPSARIRETMTRPVVLPERSLLAGDPVAVRIRILTRRERNEIYGGMPTFRMGLEEMLEYLKALDGAARAEYQQRSDEADEQLLRLAVVEPRIAADDAGDPETTIPVAALWPDRGVLIRDILSFSGFLAAPPAPPEIPPAPSPAASEVAEGGFRAPAGAAPGDGGVVAAPGVGAPGEGAG